jgi:small subunit ribosomal protein S13
MARLIGVEIPNEKRVETALTYVFGIGLKTSQSVLKQTNVDPSKRVKDLNEAEMKRITNTLEKLTLEGDLRQTVFRNIKRLKDIKSYRGIRHKLGLPVRGQNTRTNAVTRKGKNIAVGGLKVKISKT